MVRPSASSSQNFSQVAHAGTSIALLMSTRGAHSCVRKIPTGLPDWMSRVSSDSKACRLRTMASKQAQLRAALPVPPYTISSSGFSATSGSRLFMSIRNAASCGQPRHEICGPRGARTRRLVITPTSTDRSSKSPNGIFDPGDEFAAGHELSAAGQIVCQHTVILQPGDALANALIRPPGTGPGLRRPVKLQRLGRTDQFDAHSLLRV